MSEIRDYISENFEGDGVIILPKHFDSAIIGIAERCGLGPIIAYDTDLVIEAIMAHDGVTHEEAIEWYDYNIVGAYDGETTPIFINTFNQG